MSDAAIILTVSILSKKIASEFPEGEHAPEAVAKYAATTVREESISWMLATDDQRFRAMCGALAVFYKDRDLVVFARIERELRMLQGFSASMNGIPVDFEALTGGDDSLVPIGLLGIYKEGA